MSAAGGTVLITLIGYQVLLLGIGYWARRRAQDADGFFIGNRQLGPWVAALSYAAGSSSAWSILGVSGIAFSQGLTAVWLLPGTLTGHLVVWFWIAPRLQHLAAQHRWTTLTDALVHDALIHDEAGRGAAAQRLSVTAAIAISAKNWTSTTMKY